MKMRLFAVALGLATPLALGLAVPARAQLSVFDPTNYTQNLLQAARALEQINHQVASLQNEATMLQNMARNLERIDFPQLQRLRSAMARIDGLMNQAEAIELSVDKVEAQARMLFPGEGRLAATSVQRIERARTRLEAAMGGYRHAMTLQAQVAGNVREDAGLLDELVARSQGAVGALQAQQAASQLLALGIKQQLQLQDLIAAEFRSGAIERSRRAQAEADGRDATRRFLGRRRAYTPDPD